MTVCRFWQQGYCKFGDRCRFEHPGARTQSQPSFQSNNQNRYNAFQNQNTSQGRGRNDGNRNASRRHFPYHLDPDTIEYDLRYDRPEWVASGYGPGRDAPRELFGGYPLEQSPEELRVQYYLGIASNNVEPAIQTERNIASRAQYQIQTVLNDLNGACQYIVDGKDVHPNRWDVCREGSSQQKPQSQNAFRAPQQPASAFGQPSGFGAAHQRPSLSGPSFGQPSGLGGAQTQQGSFGRPSTLGQTSTFGQPSTFGRPSTLAGPSPFTQQPATGGNTPSPFAQVAQPPAPTNAFGQPPTLGGSGPAPFGQPVSAPSAFGTANGGFGAPSGPAATTGGFGRPSGHAPSDSMTMNDATDIAPNPFARAGPPAATTTTPLWGSGSGFSGQPATNGITPAQPNPFQSATTTNGANGVVPTGTAPTSISSYTTRDPQTGRLTSWKGYPVVYENNLPYYRRPDGQLERIWFPEGKPAGDASATELPIEEYGEALPLFEEAYKYVREHGTFKDGIMPEEPPRREWVRFDL